MIGSQSRNSQVKDYICHHFAAEPYSARLAREGSDAKGLKNIHVPENVGKMIQLLTQLKAPKRLLEVGTLGAYSTLWMAEAVDPECKLITLEADEAHAAIARDHIERAGFTDQIEVRLGFAESSMRAMIATNEPPFDLIFIDADKENYPLYLELAIQLSQSGTLILCDNMIPKHGEIGAPDPSDLEAVAIYSCNQQLAHHPRLDVTLFPTIVGDKGRLDALGVALVK
ncbi:MAG: putative O-methyltransferase [Chlamydiae bacterium]|nr:putative O-methyltransferase [Chlamydiota bacterium]